MGLTWRRFRPAHDEGAALRSALLIRNLITTSLQHKTRQTCGQFRESCSRATTFGVEESGISAITWSLDRLQMAH